MWIKSSLIKGQRKKGQLYKNIYLRWQVQISYILPEIHQQLYKHASKLLKEQLMNNNTALKCNQFQTIPEMKYTHHIDENFQIIWPMTYKLWGDDHMVSLFISDQNVVSMEDDFYITFFIWDSWPPPLSHSSTIISVNEKTLSLE